MGSSTAHVTVAVPADAQLLVNGVVRQDRGPIRFLDSRPLAPGAAYQYVLQARWLENGRPVVQTQSVAVGAGTSIRVTFPIGADNR
jgi:uncharacterized protein (TIGR03000 family)